MLPKVKPVCGYLFVLIIYPQLICVYKYIYKFTYQLIRHRIAICAVAYSSILIHSELNLLGTNKWSDR